MYPLKRISFFGREVPVLCQNENGPCPLIAISNVLLLERRLEISADLPLVSLEDLIQLVADRLIELNPPLEDEGLRANQQQQIDSVIQILPKLQYGLDVNVKFNAVDAFEYTQELDAFNMLGVSLYHGWLVDEQDAMMSELIGHQSYNQLIEKIIAYKAMTSPTISTDPAARKSAQQQQQQQQSGQEEQASSSAAEAPAQDKPQAQQEQKQEKQEKQERQEKEEVVVDITNLPSLYQPASATPTESKTEELAVHSPAEEALQQQQQQEEEKKKRKKNDLLASTQEAPNTRELLEGRLAQQFFAENPSQLTFHGLAKLHERMRERELAVFFRNNHFSTIFKYNGNLYLLVTDCGYQDVPQVVWEKLDMIDGDTEYYDSNFQNSTPRSPPPGVAQDAAYDSDYLVALQIQRQELGAEAAERGGAPASPDYATMVAMSEQAREFQQPAASAQASQSFTDDGDDDNVFVNPETGQPYSAQEIAWMRHQEQQFRRQAQAQWSTTRSRRKSDSGDCIIL